MATWQKIVLLGLSGALGTILRVALSGFVQRISGGQFPWGTVTVNVVGCFLFGLVWAVTEPWLKTGQEVRFLVLGGFMGAFTTFSTYVFDLNGLAQADRWGALVGNFALQNVLGFAVLLGGLALGRAFA